jgi:hypothetical protein
MTKSTPKSIPITQQIALLTEAASIQDKDAAHLLVRKAFQAGKAGDNSSFMAAVDDASIDEVLALIHGVKPQDSVEMKLASQFVATHLQAMSLLARDNSHGIMLMRLSHQTLDTLQKYRQKGSNINVNYYVKNEEGSKSIMQTNIGLKPISRDT